MKSESSVLRDFTVDSRVWLLSGVALVIGVGATFLIASTVLLLLAHAAVVGWALDIIVFVLAGINFTVGFCAGCFVYYHLGRLGLLPHVRYQGGFHWRGV